MNPQSNRIPVTTSNPRGKEAQAIKLLMDQSISANPRSTGAGPRQR